MSKVLIILKRVGGLIIHDKRVIFCIIVYPFIFIAAAQVKLSGVYAFLHQHSMECFVGLFAIFIVTAIALLLDVFQLLTLKAQGGKLKIKEKDRKSDDQEERR